MITELTSEQIRMFDVYVQEGIKIGLNTDRLDPVKTNVIIKNFYEKVLNIKENIETKIFKSPVSLWNYVKDVTNIKMDFVWPYLNGSFDINIFQFYDYMINELKVTIESNILEKYKIWRETSKLGIIYCFDDICLVSEKPTKIYRKGNIVHNDNGPAIEYEDGFSVYMLNGIRMKKEYMIPWNELDPHVILTETNAEVRRELVRKIGIERIISVLGAEVIDSQDDYELLLLKIDSDRHRPYLKMKNPSIGTYHIEGVHPDCKTVKDALKFRNGTTEKPLILS